MRKCQTSHIMFGQTTLTRTIVVTRNDELLFSDKSLKNPRGIQW